MTVQWDRQDGETAKAYAAFCVYRDLGSARSLLGAWRHQGGSEEALKAPGYFKRWSSQNGWVARAEAWDAHQAEAERQAEEDARKAVQQAIIHERIQSKRDRIDAAKAMLEKGLELLASMKASDYRPQDVIRLMAVASDQLRKDYETEQTEEEQEQKLRDLINERLRELVDAPEEVLRALEEALRASGSATDRPGGESIPAA